MGQGIIRKIWKVLKVQTRQAVDELVRGKSMDKILRKSKKLHIRLINIDGNKIVITESV